MARKHYAPCWRFDNIVNEKKMKKHDVKVRAFRGASTSDMYDYLRPLLRKKPTNVVLHVGTNDIVNKTSRAVFHEILQLKRYIEENTPSVNVIISKLTERYDNGKAQLSVNNINTLIDSVNIRSISNSNINMKGKCFNKDGLHLNDKGSSKLV